jgi:hypothetical protein
MGNGNNNVLATLPTKAPLNTLPTPCCIIFILLHHAPLILHFDLLFFNRQVRGHVGARYFAAVSAVTEMAARFGEEFAIRDSYADGAAETSGGEICSEGRGWAFGLPVNLDGEAILG